MDVSDVFEQLRSAFPREEYERIKRTVVLYDTLIDIKRKSARKNVGDAALYSSMCLEIFNELKLRFFEYYECLYAISCLGRVSNVVLSFLEGLELCDIKQENIDKVLEKVKEFKQVAHDSLQRVKYECQNKFSQIEFCVKYNSFQKILSMNQKTTESRSSETSIDPDFQSCRIFKEVRNKFFIASTQIYTENIKKDTKLLKNNNGYDQCSILQINQIQEDLIQRLQKIKKNQIYYEKARTTVVSTTNRILIELTILENEMQNANEKLELAEKNQLMSKKN